MKLKHAVAIGAASALSTLLLVFAMLATGAGAALAERPGPVTDAEPGGKSVQAHAPADGDADGGVAQPAAQGGVSATDSGIAPANVPQSLPGSRADEASPSGGSFSYYFVAGATLMPRDSGTGRDYSGTGCSFTVGGSDRIMNTELQIPNGSVIKYLRIFYNDTDASNNVLGYLTRYNPGTATNDLASVESTGSGGVGTALSAEITHTVDNFGFAYVLIGWPDASSTTVQVCGLRVAYYAPAFPQILLPAQLYNSPP
jgi:hypothetical protein